MFERKLVDLDFEVPSANCDAEFGSPAVMIRTLLLAAAMLPPTTDGLVAVALAEETERLAELDPSAAERALITLRGVRERLDRALAETRMADVLGAAIVRAADALPEIVEGARA